jgi:hypothetical protein
MTRRYPVMKCASSPLERFRDIIFPSQNQARRRAVFPSVKARIAAGFGVRFFQRGR